MCRIPGCLAGAIIARNEKLHVAHQVGTCRFGNDPATSVLDRNCRLHHMDNLYVLDGSFMPTSLGVAPALTIMANSLRVATAIAGD
jgi:choline dehydrogenase-like flavoprotein